MGRIVFHPNNPEDGNLESFRASRTVTLDWNCLKTAAPGDLYLFWFTAPVSKIVGYGIVSDRQEDTPTGRWRFWADFRPTVRLPAPLVADVMKQDAILSMIWPKRYFQGQPKSLENSPAISARLIERIIESNPETGRDLGAFVSAASTPKSKQTLSTSRQASLDKMLRRAANDATADEAERLFAEVRRAIRDARLRREVLRRWGTSCAACGSTLAASLRTFECEVAHIREVWDKGSDDPANAFPLCRTHHWAFDQLLWAFHPKTLEIHVRPDLAKHRQLKNLKARILLPDSHPGFHKHSVKQRWLRFTEAQL